MNEKKVKHFLKESEFEQLFVDELGWNPVESEQDIPIEIQQTTNEPLVFHFYAKAELKNFRIFTCPVSTIPTLTTCRKCDSQLRKYANDYISIYYIPKTEHHAWVVPIKRIEKRDLVLIEYEMAKQADFLIQKLGMLEFALDMDEEIHISDVRERINAAFLVNSEKITKDFYSGFRKVHDAFSDFIQNLPDDKDRKWYTSVMLNRLMFCYFIQKKGFLDRNTKYLRQKLEEIQQHKGEGQYYSFYRAFLRRLFSDGLNKPENDRDNDFESIFGLIPYLNGGMFAEHKIERDNPKLDISDEAFKKLFDFFDKYEWHLDTRITATGRDINPDVLGYIFEQYINDRAAMGAYYTKEDITEYIGKNCIIPWLLDALSRSTDETCHDFEPNGYVWQTMKKSGDQYIYDAVKKGYTSDWTEHIPQNIAIGLDTTQPNLLERRARWNDKTPEAFALPTEIWRETIARLQRCEDLLQKIQVGEICHPNDLITYNLDMRQFAYDLIAKAESPAFVFEFFNKLKKITVLDPTCGSGAFLFAALNILEPLYEICIERMQEFVAEKPSSSLVKKYKHHLPRIQDELTAIESKYRSNIQYFIYKTIILNNLYGVDIMPEAVEIAKLRLFLKLVAVVDVDINAENLGLDPLPDIDFNIRCGNTLVGYATENELNHAVNISDGTFDRYNAKQDLKDTIQKYLESVAKSYAAFILAQSDYSEDMRILKTSKEALNEDLKALNDILNHHYHQATQPKTNYSDWLLSHQPFHWLAEFYTIMKGNGGFDVIIGNPPYVEFSQSDTVYGTLQYNTRCVLNLHALCVERSNTLLNSKSFFGMILPIGAFSTQNMIPLMNYMEHNSILWTSFYHFRPSRLFDGGKGASIPTTIFIKKINQNSCRYSTRLNKFTPSTRTLLFRLLNYTRDISQFRHVFNFCFPKLSDEIENSILSKVITNTKLVSIREKNKTRSKISYRTAGGLYWKVVINFDFPYQSTSNKTSYFRQDVDSNVITSFLNSNLQWLLCTISFDTLNFKDYYIFNLPFSYCSMSEENKCLLHNFCETLMKNYKSYAKHTYRGKTPCYEITAKNAKLIIDEIDKVLARHYGFTEEELDYIINYDIKYRMGDELGDGEE